MSSDSQSRDDATPVRRPPIPRGVILIALVLVAGVLLVGGVATLFPSAALAGVPRSLLLFGAAIFGFLAYGLLRMRRWAWGATLAFVVVQLSFLVLNALQFGSVSFGGLLVLLAIGAYMIQPRIREAFLRRDT